MPMNLHFELEENEKLFFRLDYLNLSGCMGFVFIFGPENLNEFRLSLIKTSQFIDDKTEFEFFIYRDDIKVNGHYKDSYKSEIFKGWKDIFFQFSNLTFKYKE